MNGERKPEPAGETAADPRRTILVVEDEILVRAAAATHLRDAGYIVMEAADAAEAVRILGAERSIDLVFSDVNMPGEMDGTGLGRWIVRNRSWTKVLLTSGAGWTDGMADADRIAWLAKPYKFSDLERRVRALLDS